MIENIPKKFQFLAHLNGDNVVIVGGVSDTMTRGFKKPTIINIWFDFIPIQVIQTKIRDRIASLTQPVKGSRLPHVPIGNIIDMNSLGSDHCYIYEPARQLLIEKTLISYKKGFQNNWTHFHKIWTDTIEQSIFQFKENAKSRLLELEQSFCISQTKNGNSGSSSSSSSSNRNNNEIGDDEKKYHRACLLFSTKVSIITIQPTSPSEKNNSSVPSPTFVLSSKKTPLLENVEPGIISDDGDILEEDHRTVSPTPSNNTTNPREPPKLKQLDMLTVGKRQEQVEFICQLCWYDTTPLLQQYLKRKKCVDNNSNSSKHNEIGKSMASNSTVTKTKRYNVGSLRL